MVCSDSLKVKGTAKIHILVYLSSMVSSISTILPILGCRTQKLLVERVTAATHPSGIHPRSPPRIRRTGKPGGKLALPLAGIKASLSASKLPGGYKRGDEGDKGADGDYAKGISWTTPQTFDPAPVVCLKPVRRDLRSWDGLEMRGRNW